MNIWNYTDEAAKILIKVVLLIANAFLLLSSKWTIFEIKLANLINFKSGVFVFGDYLTWL